MNRKFMLRPVFLASCFLLLSCMLYARFCFSAEKQAERWVKELYTVRRDLDLEKWVSMEPTQIYEKRFGKRLTETGLNALCDCGLPYVILFQDTELPVERSHVTELFLEEAFEVELEQASAENEWEKNDLLRLEAEPLSADRVSNGKQSFRYDVTVNVTLAKGNDVLAQAEQQHYTGMITLEKGHFSCWRLSDFNFY